MKLHELKSGFLAALLNWFCPIYIYVILSIGIGVTGGLNAGWITGLCAFGTSGLSLVAGGGLKSCLWWGDKLQKIAAPIIVAVLMGIAYLLSGGFSVHLFGYSLSGVLWGWIGFVTCFLFTDKKLAGIADNSRPREN